MCDLYYGGSPPPAAEAQPAPAKPVVIDPKNTLLGRFFSGGASTQQQQQTSQQPVTGSAPPRKPVVAVQGGGLLGMMQGAPQERCEGTLCDLYYGGPKPERPEPSAEPAATGTGSPADDAPQTEQPSRVIEQPEERHCADSRDPWNCYRR